MKRVVGLDLRSLGLLRIGLGLVLLLDWLSRGLHFRAHYTAQGVLPLTGFLNQPDLGARAWSVFYLSDQPWYVGGLFVLGLVSALALTLGYRTSWSGWLSWVLLLSLHHRNPMVLHKGDTYLLLLLFWGNFLPWGRAFSLDGAGNQDLRKPHLSVGGVAYLTQVCVIYWFTAVLRDHPAWQVTGNALYLALNLESLAKEPAYSLLGLGPAWLAFFTFSALWLELLGPFLLLLPWAWSRMLAVLIIMSFHLGILSTLDLGNFAWICLAGPLGLLPAAFWGWPPGRALDTSLSRAAHRLDQLQPAALREWKLPSPGQRWSGLPQLLVGLALVATCGYLWVDFRGYGTRGPVMSLIRAGGLNQRWSMFSPYPPIYWGWQSARARLKSGRVLDLITEQPYPEGDYRGERSWADQRWAQYRTMLLVNRFGDHARKYLTYLAHRWDAAHPDDPVVEADYLWHHRLTQDDYLLVSPDQEVMGQYRP